MSEREPHFLELRNVSKTFTTGSSSFTALTDINLQVRSGEFICLAGPSGSGKSTLLHLIGALSSPTSGNILLEGKEISGLTRKMGALLRRLEIGFVFQTFNLIPVLTVFENIEYALLLKNVPARERQERIYQVLDELGIARLEKRRVTELSGGEQQRVAIARAIIGKPSLVLADEPTGNLDSATGESIIRMLQQINRSLGTTFIFSSHDPRIIAWADRVITLVDGKIQ